MALTITKTFSVPARIGNRWLMQASLAADTSYPTGGWSLVPADLGFASTTDPEFSVTPVANAGYVPEYDHTNKKLKLYQQTAATSALVEVTNGTNVSAAVTDLRVWAVGRFRG